ncbi:hypothetical protein AB7M17_006045 [Bradyrhizobium sp. USDA 377]
MDKSTRVSGAFGPRLGFIVIVIVICIVAWAVVALQAIKTFGGRCSYEFLRINRNIAWSVEQSSGGA